MAEIRVTKEFEGIKIERLIKRLYPQLPLSFIFRLLRKGKVRVNKRQVDNNFRVKENDSVILHIPPDVLAGGQIIREERLLYEITARDVILENTDFLAINKPAGFAVHGGEGHTEDVILKAVQKYLGFDSSSLRFPPTPVHRLDIDTSGVLIFARNYEFLRYFNELQRSQKVYKEYLALVSGTFFENEKSIVAPVIRRDRPKGVSENKAGRTLIYKAGFSAKFESESAPFTLLRAVIRTGRTHQIRSHLMQTGLPIVGDRLYGNPEINRWARKVLSLRRQFLHSFVMKFEYQGHSHTLKAGLPEELAGALEILEIEFPF